MGNGYSTTGVRHRAAKGPQLRATRALDYLRTRSVLLVEADPEQQVQIARTLSRLGHRVVGTSTGGGALALVAEWGVDLVLINQELPGMAGVDVARRLRQRDPRVPVILMAEADSPGVRQAALRAGADDCVKKPLDFAHLDRWLADPPLEAADLAE